MSTAKFSDNFWETIDKNGIAILMERMRGAKQTCEKIKNAYEARAILEEHYGKTLMQIYQKQKLSHTENGSSKLAMESMQQEMISIAESHIQLSQLIRNSVFTPLSTLLNKQKLIKKELQASIQKLYNNRQNRIQAVRKAHKRHNFEIEKANLLVQQQSDEKEKLTIFQTAKMTIDKLKTEYDQALAELEKVVDEWNKEWKKTCQSFEDLEKERILFFKTNLSNYAHLMIGCLEGEIKACEKMNTKTEEINAEQDLIDYIKENKSSQTIPSSMEYIKLAAYHETNGVKHENRHTEHQEPTKPEESIIQRMDSVTAQNQIEPATPVEKKEEQPVMVMGVMEVYPSDEEESDSEEYITESESEDDQEQLKKQDEEKVNKKKDEDTKPQVIYEVPKEEVTIPETGPALIKNSMSESILKKKSNESQFDHHDEKLNKLRSAYHEIHGKQKEDSSDKRRANTVSSNSRLAFMMENMNNRPAAYAPAYDKPTESKQQDSATYRSSKLMDKYKRSVQQEPPEEHQQEETEDYHTSAALELDDMLRELDSKRIHREDQRQHNQPDIKPTVSMSSPSLLEKEQNRFMKRPQYKPNQFDRRMSQQHGSSNKSIHMDFYDPFNSLSFKETAGTTRQDSNNSPPSAQAMYDRMVSHNRRASLSYAASTASSSSNGSMRSSNNQHDKFVENFYSIGSKTPSPFSTVSTESSATTEDNHFIDFALAQYDYEASDKGEIAFKEGDLLGIISKGEDGGEGWWEASVLNPRTQKIVRTGLVPSNFLETISK